MNQIRCFDVLRAAVWLPVLLWYRVIWNFSAQTAAVSGDLSDRLLWRLLHSLSPVFAGADAAAQNAAVEVLSFFERKAAHMFLYFVLALLVLFALSFLLRQKAARGAATALLCAVLAGLDEFHQTFVPGRSGQLRDVCIDLAGGALALGLVALLLWTGHVRRGRTRPGLTVRALLPVLLCAGALAAAPALAASQSALPVLSGLAARFVPGFSAMDTSAQADLLRALQPIAGDTLRLGLCGLLGCSAVLSAALCGLPLPGALLVSIPALLLGSGVFGWLEGSDISSCIGLTGAGVLLAAVIWLAALGRKDCRKLP